MEKDSEPKDTVKMTVTASRHFQKLLRRVAALNGIGRDELIERAVRKAYADDLRLIEDRLDEDDEAESAPHTKHLIAIPA